MPLFHFPDSGFFRTDRSSRVMAGLIVMVTAILYAYSRRYPASNRSQHISAAPLISRARALARRPPHYAGSRCRRPRPHPRPVRGASPPIGDPVTSADRCVEGRIDVRSQTVFRLQLGRSIGRTHRESA